MQTVGEKRDEDVRFDTLDMLMEDRPYRQITFEVLEGFFHGDQLQVEGPQGGRLGVG